VPETWVVNASPVITLAKAGHVGLMTALASEVLVPEAVALESLAAPATDPARRALEAGWGQRVANVEVPSEVLEWGLGDGESAVLAVALARQGCVAVLDDAQGRKCARTLGVPLLSTLGIVLRARKQGHIPAAARVLGDLRAAGLYLDDDTISRDLRHSVGESW
jgi:predicted nucleic acid-binding protein